MEILRQIAHRRFDFSMNGMGVFICRLTQRDDFNIHAALFKSVDFLRNEGLRKPRIALQDEGHPAGRGRVSAQAGLTAIRAAVSMRFR